MKRLLSEVDFDAVLLDLLPSQVVEMADLIGFGAAMAVVDRFGGVALDVPHDLAGDNGQRLVLALGEDVARALVAAYRGDKVYVNNCYELRLFLRNRDLVDAILVQMESGMSRYRAVCEVAPVFGITARRASAIFADFCRDV